MQQLASLNANRVRNDSRIWVGLGLIAVRPQLSIHNGQTTCDQSSRVVSLAPPRITKPSAVLVQLQRCSRKQHAEAVLLGAWQ